MRRSIPWQSIIEGKVMTEGPFGSEYMVPDLGVVWVGKGDIRDASNKEDGSGDGLLCNLVTLETNLSDQSVWAIVGFQAFQKSKPSQD